MTYTFSSKGELKNKSLDVCNKKNKTKQKTTKIIVCVQRANRCMCAKNTSLYVCKEQIIVCQKKSKNHCMCAKNKSLYVCKEQIIVCKKKKKKKKNHCMCAKNKSLYVCKEQIIGRVQRTNHWTCANNKSLDVCKEQIIVCVLTKCRQQVKHANPFLAYSVRKRDNS